MEKYKKENFDFRKESEQAEFETLPDDRRRVLIEHAQKEALKVQEKIAEMIANGKISENPTYGTNIVEYAEGLIKKERIEGILERSPEFKKAIAKVLEDPVFLGPGFGRSTGPELTGKRWVEDLSEDENGEFIAFLVGESYWGKYGAMTRDPRGVYPDLADIDMGKAYGVFRKENNDLTRSTLVPVSDHPRGDYTYHPEHDWKEIRIASKEELEKHKLIWKEKPERGFRGAGLYARHVGPDDLVEHKLVESETDTEKVPMVDLILYSKLDSAHKKFEWDATIPPEPQIPAH